MDHDIYAKEVIESDFFFNWEFIKKQEKKQEIKQEFNIDLKPTLEEEEKRIENLRKIREQEIKKKRKKELEELFTKPKKEKKEKNEKLDLEILNSLNVPFNHKNVILQSKEKKEVKEEQVKKEQVKKEEQVIIQQKEEKFGYINYEHPKIPFSLHYEVPHQQRQKSLELLIEAYSIKYKDRKRIVLESLETEIEIYERYKTKSAYQMSIRDKIREIKMK